MMVSLDYLIIGGRNEAKAWGDQRGVMIRCEVHGL
jgi:hypothetical protein